MSQTLSSKYTFCIHMYLLLFSHSVMTNCDPMDCSMPGFPFLHYLPEVAETHVHWVGDAIQLFHYLLPPSLPALNHSQQQGLFPVSLLFRSGGQRIGASASASVFPMNIQGWFPLGLTGLILLSKELSRVFSNTSLKASVLHHSAFFMIQLSCSFMTTGKPIALTIGNFVSKVMFLGFLIHCLGLLKLFFQGVRVSFFFFFNFMATVTIQCDFGTPKNKVLSVLPLFPLLFTVMCWDQIPWFSFLIVVLSQFIHCPFWPSLRGSLFPLCFLP